jgi:NAD+-dependent farnesol dehydrogenase
MNAYFVTGATSSIGKVLVEELSRRGDRVRALVRRSSDVERIRLPGVELVYGDVTEAESVARGMEGCDRVCHLAAIVGGDEAEAEWERVNVGGARNVLDAAIKGREKSVVIVSSMSVLMPTAPGETGDESRRPDPATYFTPYQRTKRAADELARAAFRDAGLSVKIVYPGYGYGASRASSHGGMTEQTLLRMASGGKAAIMGSGKNRFFVSYFKDTARGIILAHDRGLPGDDYLLGNGSFSFVEIWEAVAKVLGKEPPRRRMPIPLLKAINGMSRIRGGKAVFPGDFLDMVGRDWRFTAEKAKSRLGFSPGSLEDTMAETWEELS